MATDERVVPADGQRMYTRWQGTLLVGVWLIFLIEPLVQALPHASTTVAVSTLAATVGFAALYLVTITSGFQRSPRDDVTYQMAPGRVVRGVVTIVVLALLGLATVPALHSDSLVFAIYVSAAALAILPMRLAMSVVGVAAITIVLTYLLRPEDRNSVSGTMLGLVLATAAMVLGRRVRERSVQLDRVRAQMTTLAVAAERERMARDLHDILGHSLTVIVMKAELAKLLADREPARVATEVTDIERLARSALADVRATIAGSKEVTLSRELVHARAALVAAGIQPHLPGSVDDVPDGASTLFGWVLREGVTNVVRHSGAANCWVRVTERSISVIDDGGGPPVGAQPCGQGLTGLTARVSEAGGSLTVAATKSRGFEVRADLPADWRPPANFRSSVESGASGFVVADERSLDLASDSATQVEASDPAVTSRPGTGTPATT